MFIVYTDGSCNNNGSVDGFGSSAFVILKDNVMIHESVSLYENVTNNRTEYMAAINALKFLKDNFGSSEYKLYSDSMLLVNTVNDWCHNWKKRGWIKSDKKPIKNLDLVKELYELSTIHNGRFEWVKGHAGNEWNEYCDNLCFESDSQRLNRYQIKL